MHCTFRIGDRQCPDEQTTRDKLEALAWALSQLDQDEKRIICDKFIKGKNLQQIADDNGFSVATAHRKIKNLVNKLRNLLF